MGITIGDKNKIKNSSFVENSIIITPHKKESFFSKVAVNIMSNTIWWILGALFSGGLIATIVVFWENIISIFK